MSTYELDDDLVSKVVEQVMLVHVDPPIVTTLISELREQMPLPVPTKVGAVVRATYGDGTFTRWATDEAADRPWIDESDGEHVSTEKLGRIKKVLSEGVDL